MSESSSSPVKQTTAQNINAGGNISFGDISQTVNQTSVYQKPDFVELNTAQHLESRTGKSLLKSNLIRSIIRSINKNRFLVLSGDFRIDKASFARHIACCLSAVKLDSNGNKLLVKEWYRSSNPQGIDVEIQKTESPTVFVLTQVSHQNIGYDLYRIWKATLEKHYVIISTDLPFESWNLPGKERENLWHYFTNLDVEKLEKNDDFKVLINEFTQEESLEKRYILQSTINEQLILLGLCFFDGLFDDQFFAALEEISKKVKLRDQSLRSPDYIDLTGLHDFFNFIETASQDTKRIEIRFPEHRQMLLNIFWRKHQRLIRDVIPVLVDLVKKSARLPVGDLYGSDLRRNQLRKVVAETISNIGLISGDAIENALLELAADNSIEVRAVSALAMSLWRENSQSKESESFNSEEMLFNTLQRWQYEKRIYSLVANYLTGTSQEQSKNPLDYIRATVALTVGYAALYDSPNYLNESLYSLLQKLIDDSNQLVRKSLCSYTLPIVIPLHLNKLRDLLCKSSQIADVELISGISHGLAIAYQKNPNEVSDMLEKWQDPDKYDLLVSKDVKNSSEYQSLLATVSSIYGLIEYNDNANSLNPEKAFRCLDRIFEKDGKFPFVRQFILESILRLIDRYLEKIEEKLKNFISKLTIDECKKVIEHLYLLYLKQRRELKDGDSEIEIGGHKYQIWMDKKNRPLTNVEKIILNWFKDETNSLAQKVSVQMILIFSEKFYQLEERKVREIKNQVKSQFNPLRFNYKTGFGYANSSSFLEKLTSWFVTRNEEKYQKTIYNLLPELSRYSKSHKELVDLVFDRWNSVSDKEVRDISSLLQEAAKLLNDLFWVIPLSGIITIVPVMIGTVVIGVQIHRVITISDPEPSVVVQSPEPSPPTEITEPQPTPDQSQSTPNVTEPSSEPQTEPSVPTQPDSGSQVKTQFDDDTFPASICGDSEPSPNDYPVTLYPVFVEHSDRNFQVIEQQYCRDALEREGQGKIQVASFRSREKAEEFSKFMKKKFRSGWVGKAEKIEILPNVGINPSSSQSSSSSPKVIPSQPAAIPSPSHSGSDSVCFRPRSKDYDYGKYEIEWELNGNPYKGTLEMQGSSGVMYISYLEPNGQVNDVEQNMKLASCSFGLALFGNDPISPNTRERHPTYIADNLFFWKQPDGSTSVFNIDNQKVYVPVVIRKASD